MWRKVLKRPPPFESCCDEHDRRYAQGGTKAARKLADLLLRDCIKANGHPVLAEIMYRAVRIGGVPYLPTKFRWGFEIKSYRYKK